MNRSVRIAFCGAAAALQIALLFLTNLFPTATLGLTALAGVLLMPVVIEIGMRWGWCVFGISSVLSWILLTDKEAYLLFLLFFGYYPVLKACVEKYISKKPLCWLVKLLAVNLAAVVDVLAVVFVLRLPIESVFTFGIILPVLLWIGLNVVFVVYDMALSGLVMIYWRRLHPYLSKLSGRRERF